MYISGQCEMKSSTFQFSIADTGSESILHDVKITDDILNRSNGHNDVQTEQLKFYYDDHSECKDECKER